MGDFSAEQIYRHATYSTVKAWRERKVRYRLEGSRCEDCGSIYFPHRAVCPGCNGRNLEPCELKPYGTVHEVYRHLNPAQVMMGLQELHPRVVALVQLDEGPCVLTDLVEVEPDKVRVGLRVRAEMRKLRRESNSNWMYGYKFVPAEGEGA